jgi:AraC-like DNA-binding protein
MEQVNLPVAKLAPRRGLPICDVTDPGQWVPTHAVCALSEDVRVLLKPDEVAAWLSKICDPSALGPIFQQLCRASTIGMFLKQYRRFYYQFRNYANLTLERRGQEIVIARRVDEARTPHNELLELYALLEFVHIFRHLSGVCWTPKKIQLQQGSSELLRRLPEFANTEARVNGSCTAIALPIHLLVLPIAQRDTLPAASLVDTEQSTSSVPLKLSECTYAVVCSRFVDGYPEIESVAGSMGMNARSLQRHLAKDGLTYRQLVEHYRHEAARRLIDAGDRTLIDIACQLGYNEAASFTRAFRRWSGMTPSEYRSGRELHANWVN